MRRSKLHRRHARTTLVTALAFFGIGQVLLTAAIDRYGLPIRDPEYAAKERALDAQLRSQAGRPLVLALGSSRTRLALRAGQMRVDYRGQAAVCFNFGIPGAGPTMQLVCLRRLLAHGVRPSVIYVELLPALYSGGTCRPLEDSMIDASRLTAAEMSWAVRYFSHPSKAVRTWLSAALLPVRAHHGGLQTLDRNGPSCYTGDAHGWQPQITAVDSPARARLTELTVNQYRGAMAEPRLAAGKQQAIVDLLWTCRQERIEAVLVLLPESESFRKLRVPEAAGQFELFLAQLTDLFQTPLVDARPWLEEEYFFDGHHTLPEGAAIFTDRLANLARDRQQTARAAASFGMR